MSGLVTQLRREAIPGLLDLREGDLSGAVGGLIELLVAVAIW